MAYLKVDIDVQEFIVKADLGYSYRAIAEHFDCSLHTVFRRLKVAGYVKTRASRHRSMLTIAERLRRRKQSDEKYRLTHPGANNSGRLRRKHGLGCVRYTQVSQQIANNEVNCYSCGDPAKQVDHVLSIGLGKLFGYLDMDDYCAAICIPCHKIKTVADNKDLRRLHSCLS